MAVSANPRALRAVSPCTGECLLPCTPAAAAAHDSYAAAVLLAGYEKDKAAAAALLGDFRAVAAAGLRGCASTPLTGDAARRALSLADAAIQRLAAQVNPKITLSVLAAKLG